VADWTVSVAGKQVAWNSIEVTFEQYHVPGQFSVTTPENAIDVAGLLGDKPQELVVRLNGHEWFVGIITDSAGDGTDGDGPEDEPERLIHLTGRDLSEKFVLHKVSAPPPMNLTASELVQKWCQEDGFTDLAITSTSEQIGEFISKNYHRITKKLSRHDVLFDLAELEHFVFRVWRRQPYFGPQPDPRATFGWQFRRDFNTYHWNKSHTNSDVTVRVLSWNPKTKKRVAQEQGSGSLVITIIKPGLTVNQAKAIAVRALEEAERGLQQVYLTNLPGDPAIDDVRYAFRLTGLPNGLNREYWPSRVHHVITQDDWMMDLDLYNSTRITA
jgi:hypothetical protein